MRKKLGGFIKGEGVVVWPLDEGAIRVNYKCGGFGRWIFRDWISLVEDLKDADRGDFALWWELLWILNSFS